MPDQKDDEQEPVFAPSEQQRRISRRRFFSRMGWSSLALAVVGFFSGLAAYVFPNVTTEPSRSFTVGRPSDYRLGDMVLISTRRIFIFYDKVLRDGVEIGQGFQCVSDICTHLGCSYKPYGPPGKKYPEVHAPCPCHGSVFARDGHVLNPPAPRPVPFYQMSLTKDGRLRVDKAYKKLTDKLSHESGYGPGGDGIGHNIYLTPDGQQIVGDYPTGRDCIPCMREG